MRYGDVWVLTLCGEQRALPSVRLADARDSDSDSDSDSNSNSNSNTNSNSNGNGNGKVGV